MWFLCQEPCKTLDQARKRAMEIGRENFDSIHKERYGLFFKRTIYVILWWRWIEKEEVKQMERLTLEEAIVHAKEVAEKNYRGADFEPIDYIDDDIKANCVKCAEEHEQLAEWLEELKSYKNLEEQGLLVRLPCKEAYSQSGDFVYLIYDYEIIECVHCGLGIDPLSGKAYITLATDEKLFPYRSPDPEQDLDPTDWCTNATDAEVSELGKTVFLTRDEAEKKLEELKNEI